MSKSPRWNDENSFRNSYTLTVGGSGHQCAQQDTHEFDADALASLAAQRKETRSTLPR